MGKKATAGSSAFRPAQSDPNVEEAFRVLEARLSSAEGVNRIGQTEKGYDDTYLKNVIKAVQRELEEHTHRRRTAVEAGDSYDGGFKVTQVDGEDLKVDVAIGRFIYGTGSGDITPGEYTISSSTGTYYLYFEASYSSGVVTAITSSISYPSQDTTYERFVIAEIDVADSAITAIRQVLAGEIHSSRIWD